MKLPFFCLLLCFHIIISAQDSSDVFRVNYDQYENTKKTNKEQSIFYHDDIVFLSKPEDKIQHYTDLKKSQNISTIKYENKIFTNVTPFNTLPAASFNTKTKLILGYCWEGIYCKENLLQKSFPYTKPQFYLKNR